MCVGCQTLLHGMRASTCQRACVIMHHHTQALMTLLETNTAAFYGLLASARTAMLPLVYTPTGAWLSCPHVPDAAPDSCARLRACMMTTLVHRLMHTSRMCC